MLHVTQDLIFDSYASISSVIANQQRLIVITGVKENEFKMWTHVSTLWSWKFVRETDDRYR